MILIKLLFLTVFGKSISEYLYSYQGCLNRAKTIDAMTSNLWV